jgi:hypothetical protein
MMGHSKESGQDHKLDVVGGVYDGTPTVYPDIVEKEYAKLEPYINIYTGEGAQIGKEFRETSREIETLKSELETVRNMVSTLMTAQSNRDQVRSAAESRKRITKELKKHGLAE